MDKAKDLQKRLERLCNGQDALQKPEEVLKVLLGMAGQMLVDAPLQKQPVGGNIIIVGNGSSVNVASTNGSFSPINGNATVGNDAVLRERVAILEMLLDEKERAIQILMRMLQEAKDKGFA